MSDSSEERSKTTRTVKLSYFKPTSGKWYASSGYETSKEWAWEVANEVQAMLDARELPGLVKGHSLFFVLIETPNHTYPVSHLLGVRELAKEQQ